MERIAGMADGSTERMGDDAETAPLADGDAMDTVNAPTDQPQTARQSAHSAEIADDEGPAELQQIRSLRARIAELERTVADEREHANDYMRRWQNVQADFSNYKRRATQEQAQRDALLAAQALAPAIVALDSLERAFLALVELQLRRALELQGIRQLSVTPGQAFDPLRHEAVGEVESAEHPEGHVVVVVQPGYEAQGRLIRPALVQVARAAAPTAA